MNKRLLTALISFFLSGNAWGLVLSETVDYSDGIGFLPGATVNLGDLELGSNHILGRLDGDCQASIFVPLGVFTCNPERGGDTQDSFLIGLADGLTIEQIFLTSSNFTGPAGFGFGWAVTEETLFDYTNSIFDYLMFGELLPNTASGDLIPPGTVPYGPGLYGLVVSGFYSDAPGLYELDWDLEIIVGTVPLPPTFWLVFMAACLTILRPSRRGLPIAS